MWFPIPEAIVCALDRFELSISQLNVAALQNFLGVLILSYELGMDLSPDDFEGLCRDRDIGRKPARGQLWEPEFTPSRFVNRRKAKLT
ncbi:hypothetical protein DY000_02016528 [Brassica cretica]|uniref:NPH3 domain-containing protein n=1 Tax=Brassica cretica TaxID=69181 RepID=A0ABQ7CWK4_BRACR|nr:hypothetical protein DY000_02016528 [Brassica cretica]